MSLTAPLNQPKAFLRSIGYYLSAEAQSEKGLFQIDFRCDFCLARWMQTSFVKFKRILSDDTLSAWTEGDGDSTKE